MSEEPESKMSPTQAQARNIDISPSDPWANDATGKFREHSALIQNIIGDAEQPTIVAIDAPWGSGKTFFLDRLLADIKKKEDKPWVAVKFDAWKSDFCSEAFLPIASEVIRAVEEHFRLDTKLSCKFEKQIKRAIKSINSIKIVPIGLGLGNNSCNSYKEYFEVLSKIENIKDSVRLLRAEYKLAYPDGDLKIVILVDELDRCRPDYAVQVLERIKHIFDMPGVIFILALNQKALCKSINHVYGVGESEAEDYLLRFFNLRFSLSKPSPEAMVQSIIDRLPFGKDSVIQREKPSDPANEDEQSRWENSEAAKSVAVCIAREEKLPFREVQRLLESFYFAEQVAPRAVKAVPDFVMSLIWIRRKSLFEKFISNNFSVNTVPTFDKILYLINFKIPRRDRIPFDSIKKIISSKNQGDISKAGLLFYRKDVPPSDIEYSRRIHRSYMESGVSEGEIGIKFNQDINTAIDGLFVE